MWEFALCVCGKNSFLSRHCLRWCGPNGDGVPCPYFARCLQIYSSLCVSGLRRSTVHTCGLKLWAVFSEKHQQTHMLCVCVYVCVSVHIPCAQSPSSYRLVLPSSLRSVFGLGSMIPVSDTVVETRLVFFQPQKRTQTDRRSRTEALLVDHQHTVPAAVCLTPSKWLDESATFCLLTKQKISRRWPMQVPSWSLYDLLISSTQHLITSVGTAVQCNTKLLF